MKKQLIPLNNKWLLALTATSALWFGACDSSTSNADEAKDSLSTEIQNHYATLALTGYQSALDDAEDLLVAINDFTTDPTSSNLEEAKTAWLKSRQSYGLTEVFRFYGGPIDSEEGPEGQINAWPLDEAHIDYVEGNPNAGIINNATDFPTITAEVLIGANENPGETDISTGYHAIEFLLWGQDLSAASELKAGERPLEDYTTEGNAERRKTYLKTLAQLLVDDLSEVVDAWKDEEDSFKKTWLAMPSDSAVGLILLSMGSLSGAELAGERMTVALANGDQEDEHSCFSDNTHNDVIQNAQGIANLWTGTWGELSGKGIKALAESVDEDLAKKLDEALLGSVELAKEIPAPFDYAISLENTEGRAKVKSTVESLQDQTELIGDLAVKLNLTLNFE